MSKSRRILFRVDADSQSGLGHLMRCTAMAEALRVRGWSPIFCIYAGKEHLPQMIRRQHFAVVPLQLKNRSCLGKSDDLFQVLECGEESRTKIIVVDSYSISESYMKRLKRLGWFVICLDDHGERALPVNVVVNGNVGAEALPYKRREGTRRLLGPSFALLRKEFLWVRKKLGIPHIRRRVERVLLCFGGSDPLGQTSRVLGWLEALPDTFSINVLMTSLFPNQVALLALARQSQKKVRLLCEPSGVGRLMRSCDLAVTAAGVTSYELACVGVPFLVTKLYENQRHVFQYEVRNKMALNGGEGSGRSRDFFLRQFRRLLLNRELRVQVQHRAADTIDGLGADRVADALISALEE